jgi:hypothetical protein
MQMSWQHGYVWQGITIRSYVLPSRPMLMHLTRISKKIISTLEGWKIFKFNLITGLKAVPPGTAAYDVQMGKAPQR